MTPASFIEQVASKLDVEHATQLAAAWLDDVGCPYPVDDARQIVLAGMRAATSGEREPDATLSKKEAMAVASLCARRANREPLAYVLGRATFADLELIVDHRTFIPRPESALLVDIATGMPQHARVHEVGTGCGAIALATKHARPDLLVSASDISPQTIDVARTNGARLGLDVAFSVASFVPHGVFDLVCANLPHAPDHHLTTIMPPEEAEFEPRVALTAGPDGLDAIRGLLAAAPPGTLVAVQHLAEQTTAIAASLADVETRPFGTGHSRATIGHIQTGPGGTS